MNAGGARPRERNVRRHTQQVVLQRLTEPGVHRQ